jgi:hypothetical protein
MYDHEFVYCSNQLDPEEYQRASVTLTGLNNTQLQLVSPSGRVCNDIKSTLPGADFYRRVMDTDASLDNYLTCTSVETGEYHLQVSPRADLPPGTPFSVEFLLNGKRYVLADNCTMPPEGYSFNVDFGDVPHVYPRPGTIVEANPPTFAWQESGKYRFQLSRDPGFGEVIYEFDLNGDMFMPVEPLPVSGSPIYYWRIKPQGAANYDCLYAFTMSETSTTCGDINGDNRCNLLDALFLINHIFIHGPGPDSSTDGEVDGDGKLSIGDVVYIINYLFMGGPPPLCK